MIGTEFVTIAHFLAILVKPQTFAFHVLLDITTIMCQTVALESAQADFMPLDSYVFLAIQFASFAMMAQSIA
jgi:hypothetical protein